jgi:hypothetical protein
MAVGEPSLEDLGLRPEDLASLTQSSAPPRDKKHRKQDFLRGPIPVAWIGKAASLGWKATQVALAIHFMAGLRKDQAEFRLSTVSCKLFGLSRGGKLVGLKALEKAGLIRVRRAQGKNPQVTILPCEEGEEEK